MEKKLVIDLDEIFNLSHRLPSGVAQSRCYMKKYERPRSHLYMPNFNFKFKPVKT